mmetsp:Transcript_27702/g.46536  ORF Transcript_27702/g.46536 Transcript_27702/m.46536 type:complete len:219 (-) Transcript_27702:1421-2077(-)
MQSRDEEGVFHGLNNRRQLRHDWISFCFPQLHGFDDSRIGLADLPLGFALALRLVARRIVRIFLILLHACFQIFDDHFGLVHPVVSFKIRQHRGVFLWVHEVLGVDVRDALHHSSLHAFLQHFIIPYAQNLGLGGLLVRRVDVEDVVVPLLRGTRPNMRRVEPSCSHIIQVRNEDLVVDQCTVLLGPQIVHRIEVRHVHTTLVWLRTFVTILIDVHTK